MKKLLSTIMALVMLLSLVPMAVAEEGAGTETDAVQSSNVYEVSDAAQLIWAAENHTGVVKLMKDVEIEKTVIVTKTIKLDMNGKTLFNKKDIWNKSEGHWSLISVRGNGDLTITGNGMFAAKENDVYAIDLYDENVRCTIENGTFVGNIHAVYVLDGLLIVNGGTFSVQQPYTDDPNKPYEFTLNCYDASYKDGSAQIIVNGGSFYMFDPANNKAEGENTSFTGCATTQNGDNYDVTAPVAMIGEKGYATLAAAVADVHLKTDKERTQVIELLQDASGSGFGVGYAAITKNENDSYSTSGTNPVSITIKMNGHTYSMVDPTVGSKGTETNGFQFLKDSNVTFENGVIRLDSELRCAYLFQNYANLTLKDMDVSIEGVTACESLVHSMNGKVNIIGKTSLTCGATYTWSATDKGDQKVIDVMDWNNSSYDGGTQVLVNTTGTITGKINVGFYEVKDVTASTGKSTLTIENGTFNGNFSSEAASGGYVAPTITVTGGTFSSDPSAFVTDKTLVVVPENGTFTVKAATTKSEDGNTTTTIKVSEDGKTVTETETKTEKKDNVTTKTETVTVKDDKGNVTKVTESKIVVNNENGKTETKTTVDGKTVKTDVTVNQAPATAFDVKLNAKALEGKAAGTETSSVTVDKDSLSELKKDTVKGVIIETDQATLKLDKTAVTTMAGNVPTNGKMTLNVTVTENTAKEVAVTVEARTQGDKNVFPPETQNTNGEIEITIPYTGTADYLDLWYVTNTSSIYMGRFPVVNGYVSFKVTHFSQYNLIPVASSGSSVIKTGAGSSAASTTQTVTTDLTPGSITKVTVDGKVVDAKYYTVSGSNVTFTAEFLKTLKNGSHTVTVENATKIAKGVFTVNNPTTAVQAPTTADAGIALYAGMAIASVMGTGVVFTSRKRKNH